MSLLDDSALGAPWLDALCDLMHSAAHGLLRGRACRLLLDSARIDIAAAAEALSLALSRASDPAHAAAWLDGLLRGGGQLLIYDDTLWSLLDRWVSVMAGDTFERLVPILRRTFATFSESERRQVASRVAGARQKASLAAAEAIDRERAESVLPVLRLYLGLDDDE